MTIQFVPLPPPTAGKLQPKTGRTMVAGAAAGHRKFLLKRRQRAAKRRGKKIPAPVLPVLQGMASAAKKPSLLS